VVVRSDVTGPNSSRALMCQHTKVPSADNMIPLPVIIKSHWDNQPCSRP